MMTSRSSQLLRTKPSGEWRRRRRRGPSPFNMSELHIWPLTSCVVSAQTLGQELHGGGENTDVWRVRQQHGVHGRWRDSGDHLWEDDRFLRRSEVSGTDKTCDLTFTFEPRSSFTTMSDSLTLLCVCKTVSLKMFLIVSRVLSRVIAAFRSVDSALLWPSMIASAVYSTCCRTSLSDIR